MDKPKLTYRERQVYDELKRYHAEYGWMPTTREIGEAIGITYSGVSMYLKRLSKKGLIEREEGLSPRIRIADVEPNADG